MNAMANLTIRDRDGSIRFVSVLGDLFLNSSSKCFYRDDFWAYDVLSELILLMSFLDSTSRFVDRQICLCWLHGDNHSQRFEPKRGN